MPQRKYIGTVERAKLGILTNLVEAKTSVARSPHGNRATRVVKNIGKLPPHKCCAPEVAKTALGELLRDGAIEYGEQVSTTEIDVITGLPQAAFVRITAAGEELLAELQKKPDVLGITNSQMAKLGSAVLAKMGDDPRILELLRELNIQARKIEGHSPE